MNDMLKQMQDISYEILLDVADFCKKNRIRYFLSGGSTLGAVRHKGFIPWDDDVDIMLPRPDYERLLNEYGGNGSGRYKIGSLNTDPEWIRPFARIWDPSTKLHNINIDEPEMGVYVDVFPIDGLPSDPLRQKIYYRHLKALNVLRNASIRKSFMKDEKWQTVKKAIGFAAKKMDPADLARRMNRLAASYGYENAKVVAVSLALHYWEKETIPKKYMDKACLLPFRDKLFPVPAGYDRYLTNLYGDYMKLPDNADELMSTHLDLWEIDLGGEKPEEERAVTQTEEKEPPEK